MAMSVDAKLLKQTKFPLEFNQKVDMKKVNVEVMKKYVNFNPVSFNHWVDSCNMADGSLARYQRY